MTTLSRWVQTGIVAWLWGLAGQGEGASAPATTYRHFTVQDKVAALAGQPVPKPPLWARAVSPAVYDWGRGVAPDQPYFERPIPYVIAPAKDAGEPFYNHNHCPSIAWLDNGDLLACWFSTADESGTDMTILASRKRAGARDWDPASEFFKAPQRNMTGSALFRDPAGTLFHFNGMGPEGVRGWARLALLLRTSRDHGVTWTPPRTISTGDAYNLRHQVIAGTSMTREGVMIQPCDGTWGAEGPSAIHLSRDGGRTWEDAGGDIRGIHAGVVGLQDGRLLALGRAQALDGHMPMSLSRDLGKTWTYQASPFPPIGGGQRLVLMRLNEGPLLLVSFTAPLLDRPKGVVFPRLTFTNAAGQSFTGHGMYAALSFDEGATWPLRKLLTPGTGKFDGGAWTGRFTAAPDQAEPAGYLAATQTPDGVIHLLSSRLHYRFNLAWLKQPPAEPVGRP